MPLKPVTRKETKPQAPMRTKRHREPPLRLTPEAGREVRRMLARWAVQIFRATPDTGENR